MMPERCAYARSRARLRALIGEADADVAVPACPGWTVRSVCAHLVSIAVAMAAGDTVADDAQDWIDAQIDLRSGRPIAALLEEWDLAAVDFEPLIDRDPRRWSAALYDALAHEHDIRAALGHPGARHDLGIVLAVEFQIRLLRHDLRRAGLPAVGISCGSQRRVAGDSEPAAEFTVDNWWELMRSLGSRRTRHQLLAHRWTGDPEAVLPAWHMPLPAHDLGES